jgi:hypothetical protein
MINKCCKMHVNLAVHYINVSSNKYRRDSDRQRCVCFVGLIQGGRLMFH